MRAQHVYDREKLGVVATKWHYSCLYKPYYTPTMLDSLKRNLQLYYV